MSFLPLALDVASPHPAYVASASLPAVVGAGPNPWLAAALPGLSLLALGVVAGIAGSGLPDPLRIPLQIGMAVSAPMALLTGHIYAGDPGRGLRTLFLTGGLAGAGFLGMVGGASWGAAGGTPLLFNGGVLALVSAPGLLLYDAYQTAVDRRQELLDLGATSPGGKP